MKNKAILTVLFIINCAAPIHQSSVGTENGSKKSDSLPNPAALATPRPASDSLPDTLLFVPESFSVEQWQGKEFVVLPKQQMFANFGYELYFSREMENFKAPVDNAFELKNHRIRCDKLSGHVLIAKQIDFVQPEWICTFFDSAMGKNVFGKTYKSAIKELAIKNDLEVAKKRWWGKTIFSKRGLLSTTDAKNGYGSLKVLIQDSLHVDDICWGVTPLPVKPLWLMVETSDKKKGFIPIRISWTNLMADLSKEGLPWDEDIIEKDPLKRFGWDASMWELLNNHRVVVGMNRDQVLLSWGKPLARFQKELAGISYECWKYQSQVVYFGNDGIQFIKDE